VGVVLGTVIACRRNRSTDSKDQKRAYSAIDLALRLAFASQGGVVGRTAVDSREVTYSQ